LIGTSDTASKEEEEEKKKKGKANKAECGRVKIY
jgi:hypothetical protein